MSQVPIFSQFQPLIDRYHQQETASNNRNEQRYGQLLRIARQGGAGERRLVNRDFQDQWGEQQQSLMGRGLFNTTVLDAARTRNNESRNIALDQSRQNQRNTVMGIIERRTDQQPNLGLLTSLIQAGAQGAGQQAGQTGAGQGRSFNFGGVNPTRFSGGGSGGVSMEDIAAMMRGGGGGGSGFNQGVDFGGTGGGGGGGGSGGSSSGRNTGIGFNPGRGDAVVGGTAPVGGWYDDGSGRGRTVWINAGQPIPGGR